MRDLKLDPKHTALLNIDMQHFFVEGTPQGHEVMGRINKLAELCRQANMLVIHTRHIFEPNVPNVAEAVALHRGLNRASADIVLEKQHFGPFYENSLEDQLRNRGIDTVIISGIRTNVCCTLAAWEAVSCGFGFYFLSDGTATKEMGGEAPSILQAATCATFNHLFNNVVTVSEMIRGIEKAIA